MTGLDTLGIVLVAFFFVAFGGAWVLDRLLAWWGKR